MPGWEPLCDLADHEDRVFPQRLHLQAVEPGAPAQHRPEIGREGAVDGSPLRQVEVDEGTEIGEAVPARQRDADAALAVREGRRQSGFLGVINRAQWSIPIGLATLEPRFKSEFRRERPFSARRPTSTSLEETAILLWTQPLMAETVGVSYFPRYGRQRFNTRLQLGLEVSRLWLLEGRREEVDEDFLRWTAIAQLSNQVAYEGYQLVTRTGLRLSAWRFERSRNQRTNMFFLTINAGLR